MNNNLWQIEQMGQHKMREVERAVQQARLLREMGGSDAGLLARLLGALRGPLAARKVKLQVLSRKGNRLQMHLLRKQI